MPDQQITKILHESKEATLLLKVFLIIDIIDEIL